MRLSLKISVFTAIGILVVLSADGYVRGQRELRRLRNDIERDHRTLGRILAAAATVTVERAGPKHAMQLLEDVNFRENGIDLRWQPLEKPAPSKVTSTVDVDPVDQARRLVTRIPLALGTPGQLVLTESLASTDSYVTSTILATLGTSVLLIALSTLIIFGVGWWLLGTPLRSVVAQARAIGGGDLHAQLVLRRNDEMGELAREMNAMSRRLLDAHELADREAAGRITALEQLRHAERLTTVGRLASGIAHELGTPLNVVDARAQMIARGESSGEGARQDAEIISEQTRRMTQIIQQLLDFARPRRAQKVRHDLAAIVRTTLDLLRHLATRHNVVLRFTGQNDVFAAVDVSHMQHLAMNLLVNAIQAQPNGGEVRISVFQGHGVSVRPDLEGVAAVSLVVEDDGTGMAPDVRARMFEPFFTTKDVGQGTGLGLAIVYGIVEEHAGSIDVHSAPGEGTRITVVLPEGRDNA